MGWGGRGNATGCTSIISFPISLFLSDLLLVTGVEERAREQAVGPAEKPFCLNIPRPTTPWLPRYLGDPEQEYIVLIQYKSTSL